MLAGSRLVVVTAEDDALVLRPPPPGGAAVADVGAAVRDALRFPLAGEPLEALVSRGARATIVVEPPQLPLPGTERDPRQAAIAATVAELERLGIPTGYQTLLIAGGLARRAGHQQLETLVSPEFARRFHGHVEVHDVQSDDLVELGTAGRIPLRVHPALVQTDVVVIVTAAETVLHGGPAALVGAAGPEVLRAAGAYSLLETSASQGWRLGLELERALVRRVPLIGVSLVLNHPRLGGTLGGYPYELEALERVVRSPFRHLFRLLPGGLRAYVLRSLPLERSVAATFAGPPSVAHTEALLRGVELRGITLDRKLDALCLGIPRTTPFAAGRSKPRTLEGQQEVLFVVAGRGELELDGQRHPVAAQTGVFIAPGETYTVDNPGPSELLAVSVLAPEDRAEASGRRKVTVRFEDQPELPASSERTFRYLINEDAGCFDVTQFLGIVQPSKAPLHSHPYDEVGYIVEGEGIAHIGGRSTPLRAGSCFHLPPDEIHCIENTGPGVMRILGVFHPSGSPASRAYQDNN
jgi:mannose-6-phosphate isomerase-like protein (cupin superfamily)